MSYKINSQYITNTPQNRLNFNRFHVAKRHV